MSPVTLRLPNPAAEIALGQRICLDLGLGSGGGSPNDMVTNMGRSLPNLSQDQIQMLISAAVTNYCLDILPRPLPWADPCHGGPAWVDQQGVYRCRS